MTLWDVGKHWNEYQLVLGFHCPYQLRWVTLGPITCLIPILIIYFLHQFKTQLTKSHVTSWVAVLDLTQVNEWNE